MQVNQQLQEVAQCVDRKVTETGQKDEQKPEASSGGEELQYQTEMESGKEDTM